MPQTLVLSVGLDPQLLGTRDLILQSAGYIVVSTYSMREAVDRFRQGDFDLVLLCQSIPAKERERLTRWIRASGSRIPVVSVSGNLCPGDVAGGVTVGSDRRTLLWGIREVLISEESCREESWRAESQRPESRWAESLTAEQSADRLTILPDREAVMRTVGKMPPRRAHEDQRNSTIRHLSPLGRTG